MGGWVEVKAISYVAYSSQKYWLMPVSKIAARTYDFSEHLNTEHLYTKILEFYFQMANLALTISYIKKHIFCNKMV
jgi:hypothetical protein